MKTLSSVLVIAGILFIICSIGIYLYRNSPSRLAFRNYEEYAQHEAKKTLVGPVAPEYISIEGLSIQLPIIPANITSNTWETTSEGISYLATSTLPGKIGNSIMYGHNWGSILGSLKYARVGQKIVVYFSNGEQKTFEITYIQEVSPTDSSILKNTDDTRLTLYTCSGFFDQKRLVITALLKA